MNVKALVVAFNQEKVLIGIGAFFIFVKTLPITRLHLSLFTLQDCMRSMAGYQERPHFLLEFAPGGPRHHELVTEKPEEEITKETNSTIVNELPNKVDEFLEVRVICFIMYF